VQALSQLQHLSTCLQLQSLPAEKLFDKQDVAKLGLGVSCPFTVWSASPMKVINVKASLVHL